MLTPNTSRRCCHSGWRFSRLSSRLLLLILVVFHQTCRAAHSRRRSVAVVTNGNIESTYDRSVTTFDPSGRLLQVEYAGQAAIQRGGSVAAVLVHDAIYVAVVTGNGASSSGSSGTFPKVHRLAEHLWMMGTGLAGDARAVAAHLRVMAQDNILQSGESWTVKQAATTVASLQHQLTYTPGARTLGVTCIVLGHDPMFSLQPRLYRCSPGGVQEDCLYCSAGQSETQILKALQERYEHLVEQTNTAAHDDDVAVIEGLVAAVRDGLGLKNTKTRRDNTNDASPTLDVWVFRPDANKRGKTVATCFTGICDEESLAKMRAHYSNNSSPPPLDS
jgi:20S proteasome alpha/beta subunit